MKETTLTAEKQMKATTDEKIVVKGLNFFYSKDAVTPTLKNINISIKNRKVTALIGPSGCGKSTFLRIFNRMNDLIQGTWHEGQILIDNVDIYQSGLNLVDLRKRVGMVFQKSNPFPKSIYENIVYGPKLFGQRNKKMLNEVVERTLHQVGLFSEVSGRLNDSALSLSGGQQQRLCIARALAVEPDILLMDEPASALDPIATNTIENLILKLKEHYTIVIVTHNLQQASRISDDTAFFYLGELIEFDSTEKIFTNPEQKRTEDYIRGRFG